MMNSRHIKPKRIMLKSHGCLNPAKTRSGIDDTIGIMAKALAAMLLWDSIRIKFIGIWDSCEKYPYIRLRQHQESHIYLDSESSRET
jgi:hypothetical protein